MAQLPTMGIDACVEQTDAIRALALFVKVEIVFMAHFQPLRQENVTTKQEDPILHLRNVRLITTKRMSTTTCWTVVQYFQVDVFQESKVPHRTSTIDTLGPIAQPNDLVSV